MDAQKRTGVVFGLKGTSGLRENMRLAPWRTSPASGPVGLRGKKGQGPDSFCLTLTDVEKRALKDLRKMGFAVPVTRALKTWMEHGVDPLARGKAAIKGQAVECCTFWRFF